MQSLYFSNSGVSNTSVSALGSSVTVYFNPPIKLDTKKKYQIRCLSAAIVYCTPNISATKRNNILSYSKGGTTIQLRLRMVYMHFRILIRLFHYLHFHKLMILT